MMATLRTNCILVLVIYLMPHYKQSSGVEAIQWSNTADVDDDTLEEMYKHLSDQEIQELVSKINLEQAHRRKREVDERDKRLPRIGKRVPDSEISEEDFSNKDKRLPRMGRSFGTNEDRDKRLPRMGKRISSALWYNSDYDTERDKRLPRFGRAAPFPRLGRASPFPRLGRASPFPRLGRASWMGEPGQDQGQMDAYPFKTVDERASPFPRLG